MPVWNNRTTTGDMGICSSDFYLNFEQVLIFVLFIMNYHKLFELGKKFSTLPLAINSHAAALAAAPPKIFCDFFFVARRTLDTKFLPSSSRGLLQLFPTGILAGPSSKTRFPLQTRSHSEFPFSWVNPSVKQSPMSSQTRNLNFISN